MSIGYSSAVSVMNIIEQQEAVDGYPAAFLAHDSKVLVGQTAEGKKVWKLTAEIGWLNSVYCRVPAGSLVTPESARAPQGIWVEYEGSVEHNNACGVMHSWLPSQLANTRAEKSAQIFIDDDIRQKTIAAAKKCAGAHDHNVALRMYERGESMIVIKQAIGRKSLAKFEEFLAASVAVSEAEKAIPATKSPFLVLAAMKLEIK